MPVKFTYRIVLIAALLACTACASTGKIPHQKFAEPTSLDVWLDGTAGPELAALMGEHPMFKNEPFLIAGLEDEQIIPVEDDVTKQVRESLIASLLDKPGVALAWRPDAEQAVAFEDLSDPGNKQLPKIRYYIGIETDIDPLDKMLDVSVRILNVDEKKWVPGMHLSWRGAPTDAQRQALTPVEIKEQVAVTEEKEAQPEKPEKAPVIVEVTVPKHPHKSEHSLKNENDKGFD